MYLQWKPKPYLTEKIIMKVSMKENAKSIYNEWDKKHAEELERLRIVNDNPNYNEEGWCILYNDEYIKTFDDAIGFLIYAYTTDVLDIVDEWIDNEKKYNGRDNGLFIGLFDLKDLRRELEKYFECERVINCRDNDLAETHFKTMCDSLKTKEKDIHIGR